MFNPWQNASMPAHDLQGRRFGRLVVLRRVPSRGSHSEWECACDCGSSRVVRATGLIHGGTKSCGCLERENRRLLQEARLRNLIGQRYGRLTVVERAANRGKETAWTCTCECGVRVDVIGQSLTRGATMSCGCLQREVAARTRHVIGASRTAADRARSRNASRRRWRDQNYSKYRHAENRGAHKRTAELSTGYVRHVLRQSMHLSSGSPIPERLIKAKRAHLRVKRLLKEK